MTAIQKPANQRGAARLAAVQALYQMDVGRQSLEDTLAQFQTYNLGNPDAIMRIVDLASLVIRMIGKDKAMKPEFREPPPGVAREVPDIWADISRIEGDLGFRPRIGLPEGLERIRRGLDEVK